MKKSIVLWIKTFIITVSSDFYSSVTNPLSKIKRFILLLKSEINFNTEYYLVFNSTKTIQIIPKNVKHLPKWQYLQSGLSWLLFNTNMKFLLIIKPVQKNFNSLNNTIIVVGSFLPFLYYK